MTKRPRQLKLWTLDDFKNEILERVSYDDTISALRPDWALGPCWLWTGTFNDNGYGIHCRLGEQRVHRLSWRLFKNNGEKIEKGMFACHHCDNPSCCNPDHIFIGSPRDNSLDMVSKNRHSALWNRKIPKSEHPIILQKRLGGQSFSDIAHEYNVTDVLIKGICNLPRQYRHVPKTDYGQIKAMHLQGVSKEDIALKYGCNARTITRILKRIAIEGM